jgi:hypothetical protein
MRFYRKDPTQWHRIFAWIPVHVGARPDGRSLVVWLEYVEARLVPLPFAGLEWGEWEFRPIPKEPFDGLGSTKDFSADLGCTNPELGAL